MNKYEKLNDVLICQLANGSAERDLHDKLIHNMKTFK